MTRRIRLVAPALLSLLVGLLFWCNHRVPFVYDDIQQILRNESVQHGLDVGRILHDPLRASRLIQNLSFAIDWSLSGGREWSFHLTNDLLHGLNTWLFGLILLGLGVSSPWLRAGAALLFFVHPLQLEGATYVMGRTELLKTLVTLWALWLYLQPKRRKGALYLLLSLSLLIKETCVLTPLLFLGVDWIVRAIDLRKIDWREHALYLSHAIWIWPLRQLLDFESTHRGVVGFDLYPMADYVWANFHHLSLYLALFFKPDGQSLYHVWNAHPPLLSALTGLLLLLGSSVTVPLLRRRQPPVSFFCLLFLLSWLPNQSVLQFVNPFAEYRLYQCNLVLAFLLAWVLLRPRWQRPGKLLLGAFVCYFSLLHFLALQQWSNPISIWENALAQYPGSGLIHRTLGRQYGGIGLCKKALDRWRGGCAGPLAPTNQLECHTNIALLSLRLGRKEDAWREMVALGSLGADFRDQSYYRNMLLLCADLGVEGKCGDFAREAREAYPAAFQAFRVPPDHKLEPCDPQEE